MSSQKSLRNLRIETGGASSPSQKGKMRMQPLITRVEFNTTELERLFASLLEDSLPEVTTDVEVLWLLTRLIKDKVHDARLQDILFQVLRKLSPEGILRRAYLLRAREEDRRMSVPPEVEVFPEEELRRRKRKPARAVH